MEEGRKGNNQGETAQSGKAWTRWVRLRVAGWGIQSDSTCYHRPPIPVASSAANSPHQLSVDSMDHSPYSPGSRTERCKLVGSGATVSGPTPPVQFPVPDTHGSFPFPDAPLGCATHTLHACFHCSFLLVCKADFRQQLFWDPTSHPQAVGPPEPPQHPSPRSPLQGPYAGVAYLLACPALGVSAARGQARLGRQESQCSCVQEGCVTGLRETHR